MEHIRTDYKKMIAGLLILLMGLALAHQETPPGPSVLHRGDFENAHQTDLIQLVMDFAPGSWTPLHTHGGQGYVTVLEGEMIVREEDGTETTYTAGESWREHPGHYAAVGNSGDTDARILVTFLLPEGASLSATKEAGSATDLPPGPTVVHRSTFENPTLPSNYSVVHLVLDFNSGAWTPIHTHGGQAFVTVLEGEMTVREEGAQETTYATGETWVEIPSEFAAVGNDGEGNARIAVTFLLPKEAELTTVR